MLSIYPFFSRIFYSIMGFCLVITATGFPELYGQSPAVPDMVHIPGGSFLMGSEQTAPGALNDRAPVRKVSVSGFYISKTPVTVAQYQFFCAQTGRKMPLEPSWGWQVDHPMVNLTWTEAVEYTDWLSEQTGHIHRLPTETEWEYVANEGPHASGKSYSGSGELAEAGWYMENSPDSTQPVGLKKPNLLGVHDLSGNVWEWCRDWYGWYHQSELTDPMGNLSGDFRVVRGGSWYNKASSCEITFRNKYLSSARYDYIGFRVVMPIFAPSY